ncbi:hypothetical protein KFU94_07175 [Chloroflexi bacterium TSY]|nr:hypothetical protein [Chloroflexi bacterium TSY]
MWYEDIDLDWRARLWGWDCLYAPQAVVYHIGDAHGHGQSRFGAEISMRNRWCTILSNESLAELFKNAPWLIKEEIGLLRHVLTHGLFFTYLKALRTFITMLPLTLSKRHWVRRNAKRVSLPEYPIFVPFMPEKCEPGQSTA